MAQNIKSANKGKKASVRKPADNSKSKLNKFLKQFSFELTAFFLILITGTIIYSNSFDCGFHFDDVYNIVENGAVRDLSDISAWWNYVPSRPLGTLSFALNFHFHQLDVWGYHFVNLIIHIINAMLLYALISALLTTPAMKNNRLAQSRKLIALMAALLFLAHPLQTQAVTYIVQRLASMVTMFYLLSVFLYLRARIEQTSKKKQILFFILSGFAALLGMMTKENAFTIPGAILLMEICFLQTDRFILRLKDWRLWLAGSIVIAGVILFLSNFSLSIFNDIPPEQGHTYYLTPLVYLLTQFKVLVTYLRLLVLPYNQNLDYDFPVSTGFFEPATLLSFLFLLGIFITGVILFKKHRLLSFGIFWFFLTSVVESGFIPIVNVIFEHRTYLPGIGFFIFISPLIFSLLHKNHKLAVGLLFVWVVILSVLTYQRNFVWKTEYSLWEDCAKKSPNKARPLNNFGVALHDLGKASESLVYYDRAIQANPLYEIVWYNRGNAKHTLGMYQDAIKDYDEALKLKPDLLEALFKKALTKKALGDTAGAMADLNLTLEKAPEFTLVYIERGVMKQEAGDTTGALADFTKAIELFPDFPDPYNKRGNLKRDMSNFNGAIEDYNTAIKLFPMNPDAYNNRGYTKAMMNDMNGAISDFNKAIELKDDYVEAYNNRANAKGMINDHHGAIEDFNISIKLNPNNHLAICNRGISKLRINDIAGACADFHLAGQMGNNQAIQYSLQFCR